MIARLPIGPALAAPSPAPADQADPWILLLIIAVMAIIFLVRAHLRRRRSQELHRLAQSHGMAFDPFRRVLDHALADFECLEHGSSRRACNLMRGKWGGHPFLGFDLSSVIGRGKSSHRHHASAVILTSPVPLRPLLLTLNPHGSSFPRRLFALKADEDLVRTDHPEIDRHFSVKSLDPDWAQRLLRGPVGQLLLNRLQLMPGAAAASGPAKPLLKGTGPSGHQLTIEFSESQIIVRGAARFRPEEFTAAAELIEGILALLVKDPGQTEGAQSPEQVHGSPTGTTLSVPPATAAEGAWRSLPGEIRATIVVLGAVAPVAFLLAVLVRPSAENFSALLILALMSAIAAAAVWHTQLRHDWREQAMRHWAHSQGLTHRRRGRRLFEKYPFIPDMCPGITVGIHLPRHLVEGNYHGRRLLAFEQPFEIAEDVTEVHTAVILHLPHAVQPLRVRPTGKRDRALERVGVRDIEFESAEFNRLFHITAGDQRWAYDVLTARVMELLMSRHDWTFVIESGHAALHRRAAASAEEYAALAEALRRLLDLVPRYVLQGRSESGPGSTPMA